MNTADTAAKVTDEAWRLRHGDAGWLAQALQASRADTLQRFAELEAALGASGLCVPQRDTLNPPLWELGHIGWFQSHWLSRNPQWRAGPAADPEAPRAPPLRADADALYDSSRVPHASRWSLPLPGAGQTRLELARQLEQSLRLLEVANSTDAELYFFRLALAHEDMHHEAALYMALALGLPVGDERWQARALGPSRGAAELPAALWTLGQAPTANGFAFDNEIGRLDQPLPAAAIDLQVLRWADYLPFVAAGGYREPRLWSAAGQAWLHAHASINPQRIRTWQDLDPALPASHLSAHEAEAWCAWAGRRLPSEAEWERAALSLGDAFDWGQVWEWTSSEFLPWAGFTPHPYRDYSAPWFGQRRVLRGASVLTQPRLRHARYRNFFVPERSDICAGFRSCSRSENA